MNTAVPLSTFKATFVISEKMREALEKKGIDKYGCKYLADRFGKGSDFVPKSIMPITVPGDGNCALSSVISGMVGETKIPDFDLRSAIVSELKTREQEYKDVFSKCKTFNEPIESIIRNAETPRSFLGFPHFFAVSNVIRRPIIVLSSFEDHDRFGEGENGVEATFVPFLHEKDECVSKFPILVSWGSGVKDHFVPVVPLKKYAEKGDFSQIPRPSVAFWKGSDRSEEDLLADYVDFGERLCYPPVYYQLEEMFEKAEMEKSIKRREEDFLFKFIDGIMKRIEEERSRPLTVNIRTGEDVLSANFSKYEDPFETAKDLCKEQKIPIENASIIADDLVLALRNSTYPIICDSPLRRQSDIPDSLRSGISSTVVVRYVDEPSEDTKMAFKDFLKRTCLDAYFPYIVNLDAIERGLLYGSFLVVDKKGMDDAINKNYKGFIECLNILSSFKLPYCCK